MPSFDDKPFDLLLREASHCITAGCYNAAVLASHRALASLAEDTSDAEPFKRLLDELRVGSAQRQRVRAIHAKLAAGPPATFSREDADCLLHLLTYALEVLHGADESENDGMIGCTVPFADGDLPDFDPKVEHGSNVTIITFTGERVRLVENALAAELDGRTEFVGERHVLLDFTNVVRLSSLELGTLISLNRRLREVGGRLSLFNLNADLAELFAVTRLEALLGVCKE